MNHRKELSFNARETNKREVRIKRVKDKYRDIITIEISVAKTKRSRIR